MATYRNGDVAARVIVRFGYLKAHIIIGSVWRTVGSVGRQQSIANRTMFAAINDQLGGAIGASSQRTILGLRLSQPFAELSVMGGNSLN